MLFIISGPSGVGKTSIVKKIIELNPNFKQVITYTTRKNVKMKNMVEIIIFYPKNNLKKKLKIRIF